MKCLIIINFNGDFKGSEMLTLNIQLAHSHEPTVYTDS